VISSRRSCLSRCRLTDGCVKPGRLALAFAQSSARRPTGDKLKPSAPSTSRASSSPTRSLVHSWPSNPRFVWCRVPRPSSSPRSPRFVIALPGATAGYTRSSSTATAFSCTRLARRWLSSRATAPISHPAGLPSPCSSCRPGARSSTWQQFAPSFATGGDASRAVLRG